MSDLYTMHVETDKVRQHPLHLGTDRKVAETFVHEALRKPGVKSVSLRIAERVVGVYDFRDLPENQTND